MPISTESCKIGFIGAGKMAESIARGVINSGVLPASNVRTAHLGLRRTVFESFGTKVFDQNSQVLALMLYLLYFATLPFTFLWGE